MVDYAEINTSFSGCSNVLNGVSFGDVFVSKRLVGKGCFSSVKGHLHFDFNLVAETSNFDKAGFYGHNLDRITIGKNVNNIGANSLGGSSKTGGILRCLGVNPPTITTTTFGANNKWLTDGKIYVPDESVDVYKAATNWKAHASKIYPLSEYVE